MEVELQAVELLAKKLVHRLVTKKLVTGSRVPAKLKINATAKAKPEPIYQPIRIRGTAASEPQHAQGGERGALGPQRRRPRPLRQHM